MIGTWKPSNKCVTLEHTVSNGAVPNNMLISPELRCKYKINKRDSENVNMLTGQTCDASTPAGTAARKLTMVPKNDGMATNRTNHVKAG